MAPPTWIWQQPDWPAFTWRAEPLAALLRACTQAQGRLLGMAGAVEDTTATRHLSDLLAKGYLEKLPEGGRSTRYQIVTPAPLAPPP